MFVYVCMCMCACVRKVSRVHKSRDDNITLIHVTWLCTHVRYWCTVYVRRTLSVRVRSAVYIA